MQNRSLIEAIDAHLKASNMSDSTFGRKAVNDWKFVRDIRAGRRVWPETEDRVLRFIHAAGAQR